MKNTFRGILLAVILCAVASTVYGGPLAGVNVTVKQPPATKPIKQVVTDTNGNFAVDGLPSGKYTFVFRSQSPQTATREEFFIGISGTKGPDKQASVTGQKLADGMQVFVDVGQSSRIRGQVMSGGKKRMVWVPRELGSHLPGRWVEGDSTASALIPTHNVGRMSKEVIIELQSRGTGM